MSRKIRYQQNACVPAAGSSGSWYLLGGQAMDMLAAFLSGFLLYVILLAFEKEKKYVQK